MAQWPRWCSTGRTATTPSGWRCTRRCPALLREIDADPDVKVLVVRGGGRKAFASGADISEFREVRGNAESARAQNERVAAAEQALEGMSKPTIAMVHGYCIGGGCGLGTGLRHAVR